MTQYICAFKDCTRTVEVENIYCNECEGKIYLDQKMHNFESGAKSTTVKPSYSLVPIEAIQYMADRFGYGASRHGKWNWLKGVNDEAFFEDRLNHMIEHLLTYAETRDKEELKAVLCNGAILAGLIERKKE